MANYPKLQDPMRSSLSFFLGSLGSPDPHFVAARHMVMATAAPVIPAMATAMQMIAVIPAARMPAMAIATVTQKIALILTAQIRSMVWF